VTYHFPDIHFLEAQSFGFGGPIAGMPNGITPAIPLQKTSHDRRYKQPNVYYRCICCM